MPSFERQDPFDFMVDMERWAYDRKLATMNEWYSKPGGWTPERSEEAQRVVDAAETWERMERNLAAMWREHCCASTT